MPRAKHERNVNKARNLRANMSLPEVLLWSELRQQSDVKFRRQHPLGSYVLDFYCARARICIEIDGIVHEMSDRPERDATRDAWLRAQGINVIRIPASEVLDCPNDVAEALVRYCQRSLPLRQPPAASATSPFASAMEMGRIETRKKIMAKEHFERHKQPWNGEEDGQLRTLAAKGKGLREIAKALNRSEESTKDFAKKNKIEILKKR